MKKSSAAIIERFRSITENPQEYAKSLQGKGQLLAGYMCTHVPEEILYAAGVMPVRILTSHVSQAMTRSYMHETYCSFSHDCAYQGLAHNYDFLDLIVTSSSCIHMGEAFNVWVRFAGFQGKSFLIPYPHIIETKPAAAFMVESFGEFKQFLEKFVKKSITDEDIERAIKVYNHTRRLLKRLWEFLRRDRPTDNGTGSRDGDFGFPGYGQARMQPNAGATYSEIRSRAWQRTVRGKADGIGRRL